jgi:hypothetical protein
MRTLLPAQTDAVAGDSITEKSNDQEHGFAFASALQNGTLKHLKDLQG